mmetsp:Transcript_64261/g.123639  ORF Transcript_64261/g.123639 Transcript_64261/m.123639 type:complete len:336 (-) Transcript_64261:111-1118(-)
MSSSSSCSGASSSNANAILTTRTSNGLVSTLVGSSAPATNPCPSAAAQRSQRLEHMTNFELERLFALTTNPATAAALRFGGSVGAIAASRLRNTLVAQRQNNSEGYLRSWDTSDRSNVVTVVGPEAQHPPPQLQEGIDKERAEQHAQRVQAALESLPEQHLSASIDGDPCVICQEPMLKDEAVRRLPCAHLFHSECISRWLYVKLVCPYDNLPVDEGLDMLAAASSGGHAGGMVTQERQDAALANGVSDPPPPSLEPPPLPPSEQPPPPPGDASPRTTDGAPSVPPLGLRELEAAAASAGVSPEHLADALAHRRHVEMQLHQLQVESGGAPIVLE